MNRAEFMKQLESLLQDISAQERREAMQYYNDYFDDAGMEDEGHIIAELGSPAKVAATIKEGLRGAAGESGEYRETGYTDTRFEEWDIPAKKEYYRNSENMAHNKISKIILIILIAVIGIPIVLPLTGALLGAAGALLFSFFVLLICLVILAVSVALAGLVAIIAGIIQMFHYFALGLALVGAGLILFVLGSIGTVFAGRVCGIIIPTVFKSAVEICRRIFRKVVPTL